MPPNTVLEGTWEVVAEQAAQFAGKRVRLLVMEDLPEAAPEPFWKTATPEERVRALQEWSSRPLPPGPPLSDYAVSREAMYTRQEGE